MDPERGMCGAGFRLSGLRCYELYVRPRTIVRLFKSVSSDELRILRISGACYLPMEMHGLPFLKHICVHNIVLGPILDKLIEPDGAFRSSQLTSFCYTQVYSSSAEIQDRHLEGLINGPGRNLKKLTLVGCKRVSTAVLASCLDRLQQLEYFAIGILTQDELEVNLVDHLPPSVRTFKIRIRNSSYKRPLLRNERALCSSIENLLLGVTPPSVLQVDFRRSLMEENNRADRLRALAAQAGVDFYMGMWHLTEFDE